MCYSCETSYHNAEGYSVGEENSGGLGGFGVRVAGGGCWWGWEGSIRFCASMERCGSLVWCLGLLDMLALHVLFGAARADSRANSGLYEYKCDRYVAVMKLIMKERTRKSVIGLVEITHYWY